MWPFLDCLLCVGHCTKCLTAWSQLILTRTCGGMSPFHMRKLRLREVESFSKSTQLGGATVRIWTHPELGFVSFVFGNLHGIYCSATLCLESLPQSVSRLTLDCLNFDLQMSGLSDLGFAIYTLLPKILVLIPQLVSSPEGRDQMFPGWSVLATQHDWISW